MSASDHLPAVPVPARPLSRGSDKSSTTASSCLEMQMKNESRRPSLPSTCKSLLPTMGLPDPLGPFSARGALSSSVDEMIQRRQCLEQSSSQSESVAVEPSQEDSRLQTVAWEDGSLLNKEDNSSIPVAKVASEESTKSNAQDSNVSLSGNNPESDLDDRMARYAQRKARKKVEREDRLTTGVRDYGSKVRREMEVQAGRLCPEGFRSTISVSTKAELSMARSYTTAPAKLHWKELSPMNLTTAARSVVSSESSSPFGFSKSLTPMRPSYGSPTASWPGRRVPFFQSQDELADQVDENAGDDPPDNKEMELSLEEKMAIYWASKKRREFRSDDSVSRCSSYMTARSRASILGAGWTELPAAEVSHRATTCDQWELPDLGYCIHRSWFVSAGDSPIT